MSSRYAHPSSSPGLLMWRATLAWRRQVTAALRPLGLTHVQFVLLAVTWWLGSQAKQPGSQRELAQMAGVDVMMTSQVLRALAAKGLVSRDPDGGDRRTKTVRITSLGERLASEAIEVVEAVDQEVFSVAEPDEVVGLLRRLDRSAAESRDPAPQV